MTIEELEAKVAQLEDDLSSTRAELVEVKNEFSTHIQLAEQTIKELRDEIESKDETIKSLYESLNSKDTTIEELIKELEALKENGSIPPTAEGIIKGIISLEEAEQNSLAFLCRTEKEGREAFIVMIYGKGFEENLE